MNAQIKLVMNMLSPMMKSAPTICTQTWRPFPSMAPPGVLRANAAQPSSVANRPFDQSVHVLSLSE